MEDRNMMNVRLTKSWHDETEALIEIRDELTYGQPYRIEFEPGNGTRLDVVLTPGWSETLETGACTVVSIPNFGVCYPFVLGHGLHWGYVAQKLKLHDGDAQHLTELLRAIGTAA